MVVEVLAEVNDTFSGQANFDPKQIFSFQAVVDVTGSVVEVVDTLAARQAQTLQMARVEPRT
jgi:hypothetical protein